MNAMLAYTMSPRTVVVPAGVATGSPSPGAMTERTVRTMTSSVGRTRRTMNSSERSSRKPVARLRARSCR
jgi:hypothetical protein